MPSPTRVRAWSLLVTVTVVLGGLSACGPDAVESEPGARQPYGARGERLGGQGSLDRTPNLIVVVIDTLRADAVSAPPAGREADARMPFLRTLADRGTHFTQAVAPAPWTLPSMASLFTGMRPSQHGVYMVSGPWRLPDAVTTFAEILRTSYGYETAAFLNGPWFDRRSNLLQGFATRVQSFSLQDVQSTVGAWRSRRNPDKPFFLLLHTYDAHDPYGASNHPWPKPTSEAPPADPALLGDDVDPADVFRTAFLDAEGLRGLRPVMGVTLGQRLQEYKFRGFRDAPRPDLARDLRAAYWSGVRWVDDLLEQAYAYFDELGMLENTLFVVTGDHGEAFGEHGNLAHGLFLYDEVVRVPLVMSGPPPFAGGTQIDASVGLLDLMPTFLAWIGAEALPDIDGRSTLPLLDGRTVSRPVVSEERLTHHNTGGADDAIRISVRTPTTKYIATFDFRTLDVFEEAYDLRTDPGETNDLGEGTGRLPASVGFEEGFCRAVEGVRDQIWRPVGRQRPTDLQTTPYGASGAAPRRPRPPACR